MDEQARRREHFLKERWRASAAQYAAAAPELETYRLSNALLVEAANLAPGLRVLDLACGGGDTLAAAFAREPALGPCWAIDWVDEMVSAARERLRGRPVTFLVAGAQDFAVQVGAASVERVLCNSAFFQFDEPRRVLREIHGVLRPRGRVAFTLPGPSNTPACMLALQRAGLVTPPKSGLGPPVHAERCEAHNAETLLAACGFEQVQHRELLVRGGAREYARWFSLPVFRRPEWEGRSRAELESAIEDALRAEHLEPERVWVVFTAERG